ncbi:hypothetical protein Tco_1159530 [Tanacetum coccineum]
MVAYLKKTDGNTKFHQIITVNNISYIDAPVAGKPVTISEASIRSDLLFDDADGIDSLNNQAIFDNIQLMGNQLKDVPVPLDHFPVPTLTKKVLTFMVKKGKNFSGKVTPLFDLMLIQQIEDEGEALERSSDSQPIPSPPHPSEDQPLTQTALSPRPSPSIVVTAQAKEIKALKAQTIAQILITISQNKQKEKEKGVEIRNVEDTKRPSPTSTRSMLTLKPLPKIDPKDKGKKMIDEEGSKEWEAEEEKKRLAEEEATKVALTNEVQRKKEAVVHVKMLAGKGPRPQPDDDSDDEHRKCLRIITFDSTIDSEIMEYKNSFFDRLLKVLSQDGIPWVSTELEDGTEINMLAERRYPLTKHTLERMMDLRLTAVSDDDTVFDLLRFIMQQIDEFGGQDGSEKDL